MKLDHGDYQKTCEEMVAGGMTMEEAKQKICKELTKKYKGTKKSVVMKEITYEARSSHWTILFQNIIGWII